MNPHRETPSPAQGGRLHKTPLCSLTPFRAIRVGAGSPLGSHLAPARAVLAASHAPPAFRKQPVKAPTEPGFYSGRTSASPAHGAGKTGVPTAEDPAARPGVSFGLDGPVRGDVQSFFVACCLPAALPKQSCPEEGVGKTPRSGQRFSAPDLPGRLSCPPCPHACCRASWPACLPVPFLPPAPREGTGRCSSSLRKFRRRRCLLLPVAFRCPRLRSLRPCRRHPSSPHLTGPHP